MSHEWDDESYASPTTPARPRPVALPAFSVLSRPDTPAERKARLPVVVDVPELLAKQDRVFSD
jgi:hypothetical protein